MDIAREIYVQVGFLINRRCVGVDCVSYLTGLCGGYANKRIILCTVGEKRMLSFTRSGVRRCTKPVAVIYVRVKVGFILVSIYFYKAKNGH